MTEYAFPRGCDSLFKESRGMSLRDYIAIQAMNGYISAQISGNYAQVATWSYQYADAMLKARDQ